jgi:hypothetical protein
MKMVTDVMNYMFEKLDKEKIEKLVKEKNI